MKTEDVDGAAQLSQAAARQQGRGMRFERATNDLEFARKLRDVCVGRRFAHCVPQRLVHVEVAGRGGYARIQPGDRATVGFVTPVRARVGRAVGQRGQFRRHLGDQRRQREVGAERMQLLEIEREHARRLHAQRARQHVRRDERVAVAVAADPRADAQERRQFGCGCSGVATVQFVLERAIEAGHLGQERLLEEREAVRHLVEHFELLEPQDAGLPQGEHRTPDRFVVGSLFGGRESRALARLQQSLDLHFEVAHALALHLGRVRRQHGRDDCSAEESVQRVTRHACRSDPVERAGEAAVGWRLAGDRRQPIAAAVVQVLGEVRQVREKAERPRDDHRLLAAQSVQDALEFAPGVDVLVAVEGDRALAHVLDQFESSAAFLVADGVAEQAAQQADVVPQRTLGLNFDVHGRLQ